MSVLRLCSCIGCSWFGESCFLPAWLGVVRISGGCASKARWWSGGVDTVVLLRCGRCRDRRTAMSYVVAVPEVLAAAVLDVEGIGSALSADHAAAAFSTTQFVAAGGDEVSVAIAALFGEYGQAYQVLSAQASVFHARFVQTLDASAGKYVSAEAANVSPLQALEQDVLGVVNAPTELLLGRPLIGNGINATIPGGAGGAGGLLIGNGGNGAAGATGQA